MPERREVGGAWANVVTVDDLIADGYKPGRAAQLAEIEAEESDRDDYTSPYEALLEED